MVVKILKDKAQIYYNECVDSITFSDSTLTLRFLCSPSRIFFRVEYDEIKVSE